MRRRRRDSGASPSFLTAVDGFADLSALSNVSFLVASGGGLVAQYPGALNGTADLPFHHTLNLNEPTVAAVLMQYGGGADVALVQLQDPTDTSYAGMVFQVSSAAVKCSFGVNSGFVLLADLAVGQKFWMGVCWDRTGGIRVFCVPETHKGLMPFNFNGSVLQDTSVPFAKTMNGGGPNPLTFGNVTKFAINTRSGTSKILGLFCRQGNNSGGVTPRNEAPLQINAIINGDDSSLIRTKRGYTGVGLRDAVIIFHGANSSEAYGSAVGNYDEGVAIAGLVEAGYITAYMRGTDDLSGTTYSGPKASNWGHPASLAAWWKALHTKLITEFDIRNIYLFGMSMGLVNALNFYRDYPTGIKAIIGISGVCNLTYAHDTEGFASVINAAYGSDPIAPRDPNLHAADFLIPIKLWHGTIDTTVHKANHMDTFAATVNAVYPGRVSTVSVVGGDHLTANMFDAAAILAFIQANP